ncbi:hypothetical protein M422DRAFT_40840 [Sphaerobolus stellatus SS14]|nr:hypothetical protein M422DRAFT_40840 [Sphaerobolus stellatus SS14]
MLASSVPHPSERYPRKPAQSHISYPAGNRNVVMQTSIQEPLDTIHSQTPILDMPDTQAEYQVETVDVNEASAASNKASIPTENRADQSDHSDHSSVSLVSQALDVDRQASSANTVSPPNPSPTPAKKRGQGRPPKADSSVRATKRARKNSLTNGTNFTNISAIPIA